jgi:hypothetical protein
VLVELTSCFDDEPSFLEAQRYKDDRYTDLVMDLRQAGYDASAISVEVGCRGIVHQRGLSQLFELYCVTMGCSERLAKLFVRELAKEAGQIALCASFAIWSARRASNWRAPPLFSLARGIPGP